MRQAVDLKDVVRNAVEDIFSSYERGIGDINAIFVATNSILNGFQESFLDTKEEREEISSRLRDILARNEHLRKKDFDNMMRGILSAQEQREDEIRGLLKNYINDQKVATEALRKNLEKFKDCLARGEAQRVREFQVLIRDILAKQEKRKQEVTAKLKEFQKQHHDLATRLRKLLARGNKLRIKDFKVMLEEFKGERKNRLALKRKRKKEVVRMLGGFRQERQRVSSLRRVVRPVRRDTTSLRGGKRS